MICYIYYMLVKVNKKYCQWQFDFLVLGIFKLNSKMDYRINKTLQSFKHLKSP